MDRPTYVALWLHFGLSRADVEALTPGERDTLRRALPDAS